MKVIKGLIAVVLAILLFASYGPSEGHIKSRTVMLQGDGSCSGEQVVAPSGESYILTAGHCRGVSKDGISIEVKDEFGHILPRRIIAEDPNSDLLLLEGLPGVKGLKIAGSWHKGQHIRTFTHGRGLDLYKTEGYLVQEKQITVVLPLDADEECPAPKAHDGELNYGFFSVQACILDVPEIMITAMVAPGSSGGLIVDDAGDLIGVVSVGDGVFGGTVRLQDIQKFLNNY